MKDDFNTALNEVTQKKRVAFIDVAIKPSSSSSENSNSNQSNIGGRPQVDSVGSIESSGVILESPLKSLTDELPTQADLIKNTINGFLLNLKN